MPGFTGGWYGAYNPYAGNTGWESGLMSDLDKVSGPAGSQTNWWDRNYATEPNTQFGTSRYHQRLGRELTQATGMQQYYNNDNDYQALGENVARLADIARVQAYAKGLPGTTGYNDTAGSYLKQALPQFLKSGSIGQTLNLTNPASPLSGKSPDTMTSVADQLAANAHAMQAAGGANPYTNNYDLMRGLNEMNSIQNGGGLASAYGQRLSDLYAQMAANNGNWWTGASGQFMQPFGGSFAPNVVVTPANPPVPTAPLPPASPVPTPAPTPPANPPVASVVGNTGGGVAPHNPLPPTSPARLDTFGGPTIATLVTPTQAGQTRVGSRPDMTQVKNSFRGQLNTRMQDLLGRDATDNEVNSWWDYLQQHYGGNIANPNFWLYLASHANQQSAAAGVGSISGGPTLGAGTRM